jgi:hypothetical protein
LIFQNGCRCDGNGQNAKKLEKHKNDHSRLLAEQKLMKQHPHLVDRDKPKKKIGIGWTNFAAVAFIFSFLTIYFDFILAAILKFEKQRAQL